MRSSFPRSPEIRARNPVFNDNRLKLGLFAINWGSGMTLAPEALVPTWENSLEVGRSADRLGFEAVVPISRWKSLHPTDAQNASGVVLEPLVWAAAMAAATERTAVFATCHVAAFHPMLLAKQAASIDRIAGGRFGINVVAGWNPSEARMFGTEMLEHDDRYAQAAEWIDIVKRIWTSEDEFDHHGRFYDLENACTMPLPGQDPGPVLMNAGGSEDGRAFCVDNCDIALIALMGENLDDASAKVDWYRRFARERGRELAVWTIAYVVHGDTDDAARDKRDHYAALGDYPPAYTVMRTNGAGHVPEAQLRKHARRLVEGNGGYPIVGSTESIANQLETLSAAGIDGVLLSWIDFIPGMNRFADEVLPILEHRGLRAPSSSGVP